MKEKEIRKKRREQMGEERKRKNKEGKREKMKKERGEKVTMKIEIEILIVCSINC